MLYKEVKFLKKERAKVAKFLKRASKCKTKTCQRRNERFARRAERSSRRKQRKRYMRRRRLACFSAAKAAEVAKKVERLRWRGDWVLF